MSLLGCARESDVMAAAASNRWPEGLRAHVLDCRHCNDVALAVSALRHPVSAPAHKLDPGVLWMRARFARRQRAEAQVSRLLLGAQIAVGTVVAGALIAVGRQVAWWNTPTDAAIPASLAAVVGVVMLAAIGAASLLSRES
jgi:hypothetical protein